MRLTTAQTSICALVLSFFCLPAQGEPVRFSGQDVGDAAIAPRTALPLNHSGTNPLPAAPRAAQFTPFEPFLTFTLPDYHAIGSPGDEISAGADWIAAAAESIESPSTDFRLLSRSVVATALGPMSSSLGAALHAGIDLTCTALATTSFQGMSLHASITTPTGIGVADAVGAKVRSVSWK